MRASAALAAALTLLAPRARADVSGRVLAPDGAPVAGATVDAYAQETSDQHAQRLFAGRAPVPLATSRTGADGAFRLVSPAAVLELQATADGRAPAFAVAAPETPVTMELKPAAKSRGVIRAGGRPVVGARVVWMGGGAPSIEWMVRTAADGSYEVPDPTVWSGAGVVFHPDYAPLDLTDVKAGALDRELDAGVPLAGTVVDERGRPVANAPVWVVASRSWPLGSTGADGRFAIAHAPRQWSVLQVRTASSAGALTRQSGPLTVVVRPSRVLTGSVRDAASGQPLPGATVYVMGSRGRGEALTDAAGVYRVEALPAGRYQVAAHRPGYTRERTTAPTPPVDLRTAAQARADVSLRRQPMVSGRVRDEGGRPVGNAQVRFGFKGTAHVYGASPFGELDDSGGTRTAPDGSFTLPLPEEDGLGLDFLKDRPLIVLKPGYAAGRAEVGRSAAGVAPVTVTLTRGIELRGRVRAPSGAPLAGVAVTLAEDGFFLGSTVPSHVLIANARGEGWTTSDAEGRFSVRVHPAVHHVSFRAPGMAPKVVRDHDPRAGEELDVVLDPAAVLRGRVVRADGRGVADVSVKASQPSAFQPSEPTTTGADGSFDVKDLAPGTYELSFELSALGIQQTRTVEAPAADVLVVLEPSGTLRGRVIDAATRQPVPAFQIATNWPEEPGRAAGYRSVKLEDAGGAFVVTDLPARTISVHASAEGYAPRQVEGVSIAVGSEGAELEIALESEKAIRGRVTSEDNSGIPEGFVSAAAKGGREGARAAFDEQGGFELRGMAAGEVTLSFQGEGFLTEKRTLDTRQTAQVNVTLRRGLSLAGVVVADGAGVSGATVVASSSAANAQSRSGQTDAAGRFKLEGLVPGRYRVMASAQDKGMARLDDVDPEAAGPLRLALSGPHRAVLTGKVVGVSARDELVFVEVNARNEDGESAAALADGSGAFRMEDAPAGRVTVAAQASSPESMRSSRGVVVTLAPGAEAEVVLEFPTDTVSGQVTRDGRPVAGARVSFDRPGAPGANGRTDARGNYEVVGLESGRYTVSVSGDGSSFAVEHVVNGSGQLDIDITGGVVQGRAVRADDGAPLVGVEVTLWPVGARENRPAESTTTNGEGEFTLRSLREGPYRLTTSKAGFGQQVRELDVARAATASVLVELSPAAGITVAVVDARGEQALEATVVVRDGARHIVANSHSGVEGDGTLNIPLADGSYLLSTSASGYGTATLPVTAPSQGLRVGLTPGGTLVIESPREQQGRVRLVQPDGEEYVQCWCNGIAEIQLEGRRTTVEHVTPNSYTLEVIGDSGVLARRPVVIREGQKAVVIE